MRACRYSGIYSKKQTYPKMSGFKFLYNFIYWQTLIFRIQTRLCLRFYETLTFEVILLKKKLITKN